MELPEPRWAWKDFALVHEVENVFSPFCPGCIDMWGGGTDLFQDREAHSKAGPKG